MQLRRVLLHDVGPFRDLDLQLPPGRVEGRADVHLLVGPNGSGKSTILTAIAQCFTPGADTGLRARMRLPDSWAGVATEDWARTIQIAALTRHSVFYRAFGRDAGGGGVEGPWRVSDARETPDHLRSELRTPGDDMSPVPWAIFAYGGLRSVNDGPVSGVRELNDPPLVGATQLVRPEGTRPMVQWVINTLSKQAVAAQQGATGRVMASAAALTRLREAIGQVVGAEVRFELALDDLSLRVAIGAQPASPVELLPDGLKSLLAWLGDLLMRLDRTPWASDEPITDRRFTLLLDEVEVHLHPAWQRRVLPMVERLFPNAQIIASTHSPFVIGSASDAWIHVLSLTPDGVALAPPQPAHLGSSYPAITAEILGVREDFDLDTEAKLAEFGALWARRLTGDAAAEARLDALRKELGQRSEELGIIVETRMRDLHRRLQRAGGPAT